MSYSSSTSTINNSDNTQNSNKINNLIEENQINKLNSKTAIKSTTTTTTTTTSTNTSTSTGYSSSNIQTNEVFNENNEDYNGDEDIDNLDYQNHHHSDTTNDKNQEKTTTTTTTINKNKSLSNATTTTREIETLTDICSSENIAEVEVISLLDEKIPQYKLRADTIFSHSNCDWIRAPLYIDEQQISELTNEQIQFTLDYFILSGYRVSQMTKTYYDIEAVTKLLDEKEKDLELAATIGKQLLEKDQQLEAKIEFLEIQLEKTSEMVNQLRYEISLKDNLLKSFMDSESDINYEEQIESKQSTKIGDLTTHTLLEYKQKISYLENENDHLKNKAEYFERETADLETKESFLIENCFKELEHSQSCLRSTEEELQAKTAECYNQQEEIQNLFSQICELQLRVKNLTRDNNDLKTIYESSATDLTTQINQLKEKYNECLQILNKTQEELNFLRRRSSPTTSRAAKTLTRSQGPVSTVNINSQLNSSNSDESALSTLICDDDFSLPNELDSSFYSSSHKYRTSSRHKNNHGAMYSPWMPTSSINTNNSLAAEVFSTIAKDYRMKNSNLTQQASQSSDFIKKVKQKLTKQIPGSNIDSCLQSDSEIELMMSSTCSNLQGVNSSELENAIFQQQINWNNLSKNPNYFAKFTNCPTPDSILSTGSASIYSNLMARSNSFLLPEKLQIVKPIEGSQTLQHWQHLATPNLACLFENRPGISVKASNLAEELEKINQSEKSKEEMEKNEGYPYNEDEDYDDGVNLDMYDENEYDDESDTDYFKNYTEPKSINRNYSDSFNYYDSTHTDRFGIVNELITEEEDSVNESSNQKTRVLSPSKVEILTKLLEDEEKNQNLKYEFESNETDHNNNENFFMGLFRNLSTRYFKSTSLEAETFPREERYNSSENNNNKNIQKYTKKRHEFADPDTPPSSPINVPNSQSVFYDVLETAKVKCKSAFVDSFSTYFQKPNNLAPTPPGTPTIGLELNDDYINDDYEQDNNINNNNNINTHDNQTTEESENTSSKMQSFFDQIVNKLSLFSFKTVTNSPLSPSQQNFPLFKPSPIYASSSKTDETLNHDNDDSSKKKDCFVSDLEERNVDKEDLEVEKELMRGRRASKCETPPPSPSKFSPPLPQLDYTNYTEEEFKKSAFVKVTSLNPYINKSVDLASLLGSLSSLKRSQRLCKYNENQN